MEIGTANKARDWTRGLTDVVAVDRAARASFCLEFIRDWTQSKFGRIVRLMTANPATLLRQYGVHVTARGLAVLRAVSNRPRSTAEELAEYVRGVIGTISRQAVFDAHGVLAANGLIRRIRPGNRRALLGPGS